MHEADIAVIYGTRPEAIKMSPIARAIRETTGLSLLTVSTHQHASLLHDTLAASHLMTDVETPQPDGSTVQALVSSIGMNLQQLDLNVKAVAVQGDTVSAYAGAVFGFLNEMSVIHIEAGLRTSTLRNPYPEEGFRRAISQLTDLHLAPTPRARHNLESEGVPADSIVVTGNTSIDALLRQLEMNVSTVRESLGLDGRFCVVTVHRRESWGAPIARVAAAIDSLALSFPDVDFICPLHPNPKVREEFADVARRPNVRILDPIPHDDFVGLLRHASMIITDSGGIQEEVTVLGVPTLVVREETERPEAVEVGVAHVVGTDITSIIETGSMILAAPAGNTFPLSTKRAFGDGHAGERCAQAIAAFLDKDPLPVDFAAIGA